MAEPQAPPSGFRPTQRRFIPVVLTAMVGLATTSVVAAFLWKQDLAVRDAHFHRRAVVFADALQRHLDLEIEVVESVARLFDASAEVHEAEFGRFVREPLLRHPELLGLCWAPRLERSAAPSVEEVGREGGETALRIWAADEDGTPRPVGDAEGVVPVLFVHPPEGFHQLRGFDLSSWPGSAPTLQAALRSAKATFSGPMALPPGLDPRAEATLVQAVFSEDGPATEGGERAGLKGFVVGILCLDELVTHSARETDTELLELRLTDLTEPDRPHRLYPGGEAGPSRQAAAAAVSNLRRDLELRAPGRRWTLTVEPTEEFFTIHRPKRPWLTLLAGLCVTAGLSALVLVVVRRTDRIERLAAELVRANRSLEVEMEERRLGEEAVRRSEERYRLLVERNLAGVYRSTLEGRILMCNEAFARMFGFSSPAEAARRPAVDFYVSPEDRRRSVRLLQERGELHSHELKLRRKDGTPVPVLMNSSIVVDEGERERVIEGILLDISDLRRAEEALRLTQFAVDRSADGVFWMGPDARLIYVNDAACRSLGFTREELLGRSVADIDPDFPAEAWPAHWEALRTEGSLNFESRHRRKDGTVIPVEITANYLDFEGKEYNCAFARDIRDRKRREQERAALQAQLHQAQKLESLGVLAGGIAHDFNNMLMTIMGNVGLARLLVRGHEKVEERLVETEKACLRARDLTQQLLTFSKGGAPVLRPVGVADLITDSATFAARGTSSRVETSIDDDLWAAEADGGQIGQVIQNLVINAAQAMPQGGVVTVRASNVSLAAGELPPLEPGRYVRISTSDHGIGVPAEHLERIFDPFFSTKQSGSGLGLASAFSIARSHGGTVTVESELGQGSTFTLYVPASDRPARDNIPASAPPERGEGRVLIMDDDEAVRDVTAGLLSSLGFTVQVTPDGQRAVEAYRAAAERGVPFDVVVLDLTVRGGKGGREAMKELLEIDPGVRAIVASGYSTDPVMADYRRYGFRGVAAKPIRAADLARVIQEVMAEDR